MPQQAATDPPQHLVAPRGQLDYYDRQSVVLDRPITPIQAWNMVRAQRRPVLGLAFRIRDAISARFGVRRIGGFTAMPMTEIREGARLDFFRVEHAAPDLVVLTERDRHLDVMICLTCKGAVLTVTASVVTHNRYGRAYMRVVGPAHRLIVRGMLRRMRRDIAASPGSGISGGALAG